MATAEQGSRICDGGSAVMPRPDTEIDAIRERIDQVAATVEMIGEHAGCDGMTRHYLTPLSGMAETLREIAERITALDGKSLADDLPV